MHHELENVGEIPAMIVDRQSCRDYSKSSRLEWLEANGLGGYASGTVSGCNTRRYHGYLVASLHPPVDRYVLLAKVDEVLALPEGSFDLSANQFPFVVHPNGFTRLEEFRLDPFPVWTWEAAGTLLRKSLFTVQGENTTVICYELMAPKSAATLTLKPFVAYRDFHALAGENPVLRRDPDLVVSGLLVLRPYDGLPALRLHHNAREFEASPDWYRKFEYLEELDRGLDFREDLFAYGSLHYQLSPENPKAYLVATVSERPTITQSEVAEWERGERRRRNSVSAGIRAEDPLARRLARAADSFVVKRADGAASLIAGYHWFTDWGRDTMISLPGLVLATGRYALAREILSSFLGYLDRGMLPNRFPDRDGVPEYNTVDATLWLFHAVHAYGEQSGDMEFVCRQAYPRLKEVIGWHLDGTRYGIQVDPADGLLRAGEPGVQLTWMDAKIGDWVVTPRQGKPVEINALWHNALKVMQALSARSGRTSEADAYGALADRARESFLRAFWNPDSGCLFDCVGDGPPDPSIRPNQIFAASLPFGLLSKQRALAVIEVVQRTLLTPFGLRSLSPDDPQYRPVYTGGPVERDSAYHQGTVWPWLLGPFVDACLNTLEPSAATIRYLRSLIEPFRTHAGSALLGSISEIFDATAPHAPKGCAAQAWSVAEILRAIVRIDAAERALAHRKNKRGANGRSSAGRVPAAVPLPQG